MKRIAMALALLMAAATTARGQTVRATGITSLQLVQLRPLVVDSVPVADAPGDGLIRRTADGRLVRCVTGDPVCRFTRSGDRETVTPLIQDVNVSAWGFGRGIRLYAQLRTRSSLGSNGDLWPRADDRFDALSAYIEFDRDKLRLRGGRQWKTSGLGYYNFDGISALYRALPGLSVEAFGGWSLARNLNEPRTSDAISAIETFAPDDRALILGAQARYRPSFAFSAGALYQREIRNDRLGLYSERGALDAAYRYGRGSVTGSLEADIASSEINDARLRVTYDLKPDITVSAFGRIYEPFFELWTIWGAFSPVGFNEGRASVAWSSPAGGLRFEAGGAYRDYEEANAGPADSNLRDDGWRAFVNGNARHGSWFASGGYRSEAGFGAARFGGDLRAGRWFGDLGYLSVRGSLTQTFGEFRLNEQVVSGIGVDGSLRLGEFSLTAGAALYDIDAKERPGDGGWTQTRVYSSLSYRFGRDPGLAAAEARGGGS